jgi:hypothetical protein
MMERHITTPAISAIVPSASRTALEAHSQRSLRGLWTPATTRERELLVPPSLERKQAPSLGNSSATFGSLRKSATFAVGSRATVVDEGILSVHMTGSVSQPDAGAVVGFESGVVIVLGIQRFPNETITCLRSVTTLHVHPVTAVALQQGVLASCDASGSIRLVDAVRSSVIGLGSVHVLVTAVSLSGSLLCVGTLAGVIFAFATSYLEEPVDRHECDAADPVIAVTVNFVTGKMVYAQPGGVFHRLLGGSRPSTLVRFKKTFPGPLLQQVVFDVMNSKIVSFMLTTTGVIFPVYDIDLQDPLCNSATVLSRGVHVENAVCLVRVGETFIALCRDHSAIELSSAPGEGVKQVRTFRHEIDEPTRSRGVSQWVVVPNERTCSIDIFRNG